MRKRLLVLGSIMMLLGSFLLINRLQVKNFTVFNDVSPKKVEEVKENLNKTEELSFTALLCNEIRVPFDDATNTFFVPLNMEDTGWEKMEFISGQPEYGILFQEDVTDEDKRKVIASNKKIELIVFDQQSWAEYYVTFTGLPVIDLSTNEGFYATEEITGRAVFFDTDFTLHGTQQSEYNGHIRGNTSRMFPKKGYKINLTTTSAEGMTELNKLSLFGMRKDDDWILHALYNDDTKLRDCLSMEVWDTFGAGAVSENSYYGPKMIYVEVFADNSYCGVYGLMEPVDGKQLNLAEEDYSYKRKNPGSLAYHRKDFEEETDPYAEVEGFVIKDGLISDGADLWKPLAKLANKMTISEDKFLEDNDHGLINEESAIRLWLFLQMITGHDHTAKNVFYIAKYNDDLKYNYEFYFAPWDMDLTWGNVSVGEINPYYTAYERDTIDNRVYWDVGDKLIDTDYNDSVAYMENLYARLRKTVLTNEKLEEMILNLDHELRDSGAFARDKERWPEGIHADSCEELLNYATGRLEFLDKALYNFKLFED